MIRVDGVLIDDDGLFGLAHVCEPDRYGAGCVCCQTYEVNVAAAEIPLLDGCVALAVDAGLLDEACANPFEELDDGEICIDADEDGQCVCAVRQSSGASYCALHTAALMHGLEPYTHKPHACTLWPVAASADGKSMGVTSDALEFPCNRKRRGSPVQLHRGIAEILDLLYGRDFRRDVERIRRAGASE